MVKNVSPTYAQITNLIKIAKRHKENCHESCDVSLQLIRVVIIKLFDGLWDDETDEIREMVKNTNWI